MNRSKDSSNDKPLRWWSAPGGFSSWRRLHLRFAGLCRFKPHTRGAEWFTPSPDLLGLIAEASISPEDPGFPRFVHAPNEEDAAV